MTHLANIQACAGVTSAKAVGVTIGKHTYTGVYFEVAGRLATLDLLGEPPRRFNGRVPHLCKFVVGDVVWTLCGSVEPAVATDERYAEFHPNGAHWMLCQWTQPEAVDAYASKPYTVIKMKIEEVNP